MAQRGKMPVYAEIAAEIQAKAEKGFFSPENRLPSRKEICLKYNVSDMTACKVHNELERIGAAYKVRGSGVFFCQKHDGRPKKEARRSASVRKIVFFNYEESVGKPGHVNNRIFQGVQRRAFELGVGVRAELFSSDAAGSCHVSEDEGLVVPYNAGCEWLLPMMEHRRVRCVMVNNYFSEAHCVVNDNYAGMFQLLGHLASKGCRRLVLATGHFTSLGIANLSDRTHAFELECGRRGLESSVVKSGNFNELMELLRGPGRPCAVMFPCDGPALKFKEMLAGAKVKNPPVVTGFDGWCDEAGGYAPQLTTVKVGYEAMGAAAVDLMFRNSLEDWNLPDVVRVPCELLVHETD